MTVELLSKIATGGFADVWLGKDNLDRDVAVKIVRPDLASVSDALAHAKALARADHANVVRVYNVDKVHDPESGTVCDCIVMELVRGGTLSSRLDSSTPLSMEEAQTIMYGLIAGLEHIHAQRLVHGDLHEENVMIENGRTKIIDILYKNTLALLSEGSREAKIQRDIRNLVLLLNRILDALTLGGPAIRSFARGLGERPSFAELRSATAAAFAATTPKNRDTWGDVTDGPFVNSVQYFYEQRLTKAFPGVRGVEEFNAPKEVVGRLDILFRSPLGFRHPFEGMSIAVQNPIWWWRGSSNCHVQTYRQLTDTDILLDGDELRIRRAIVCNTSARYEDAFVYLEFDPMAPTGLYPYEEGSIEEASKDACVWLEEFAIFRQRLITREEYDDGAAVIDGKVVETRGEAELRRRFITPYNLIISAQMSPINNTQFDEYLDKFMTGMLRGTSKIDDLVQVVWRLPRKRHHNDDI